MVQRMDQIYFTNNEDAAVLSDRVLYTPSPFAKSSLMYLQEIGTLKAHKEHTSGRRDLESYLFMIVCSGSGKLKYDGMEYELHAGECAFVDCHKPYSHTTAADDLWQLKWIHFCGEMMPAIYEKYTSRGGKPVLRGLDAGTVDAFTEAHAKIYEAASSEDYIQDMRINEGLNILLTLLMEQSWDPDEAAYGPGRKDLLPVRKYLDEHFLERITLDDLADRFYINKYYLTRIFKAQYGVSINAYISHLRITKAKHMLRFTNQTVEEIGEACGIGEQNYFSRFFKKIEGMSPSQYRNRWQVK